MPALQLRSTFSCTDLARPVAPTENTDLAVYVHIPFCSSKCHFCSWVSHIPAGELVQNGKYDAYTSALCAEADFYFTIFRGARRSQLLYFGGGTPSILETGQLIEILSAVEQAFPRAAQFDDVTIEVSPETVDRSKLDELHRAGFTRVSIGVQSLVDSRLRAIGRSHTAADAIRVIQDALELGYRSVNVDLIVGFPNETKEEWKSTLGQIVRTSVPHISVYLYRRSPGTLLARRSDTLQLRDLLAKYRWTRDLLVDSGFAEYMFQMFGKAGHRCRADQRYFELLGDYVGLGAGAHSLLDGSIFGHDADLRPYLLRPSRPSYSGRASEAATVLLTKAFEMMHTPDGIDFQRYEERLGVDLRQTLAPYPELSAFLSDLSASEAAVADERGIRFRDPDARLRWMALFS